MNKSKNKNVVWGSPEYIKEKFDDVSDVWELSGKCVASKTVKAAVTSIKTKKDNLSVRSVMQFAKIGPDGKVSGETGFMAVLDLGLNGNGKQADYFDCLKKVAKFGFLCSMRTSTRLMISGLLSSASPMRSMTASPPRRRSSNMGKLMFMRMNIVEAIIFWTW